MKQVLADLGNGVLRLTLARPHKRNALNGALVEGLSAALARAASDPAVRVVALYGQGKDFSAGADLGELAGSLGRERGEQLADARRLGKLYAAIRHHPRPVVAVVRGRALGGGCGLAAACDAVLAHEDAVLGFPEVRIGFVPALVMAVLRRKVPEYRAFDLVALGEPVTAAEAERIGLVTRVIGDEAFDEEADRYLTGLADRPPGALAATKKLLVETDGMAFDKAIALGAERNVDARASDELRAGLQAFLGRPT